MTTLRTIVHLSPSLATAATPLMEEARPPDIPVRVGLSRLSPSACCHRDPKPDSCLSADLASSAGTRRGWVRCADRPGYLNGRDLHQLVGEHACHVWTCLPCTVWESPISSSKFTGGGESRRSGWCAEGLKGRKMLLRPVGAIPDRHGYVLAVVRLVKTDWPSFEPGCPINSQAAPVIFPANPLVGPVSEVFPGPGRAACFSRSSVTVPRGQSDGAGLANRYRG
jgi:hypothetical protein